MIPIMIVLYLLYLSISVALLTAWTFQKHSQLQIGNWHCVGVYTPKCYRQLQVKDLPMVLTWQLERAKFEPATIRSKGIDSTNALPCPTCSTYAAKYLRMARTNFNLVNCHAWHCMWVLIICWLVKLCQFVTSSAKIDGFVKRVLRAEVATTHRLSEACKVFTSFVSLALDQVFVLLKLKALFRAWPIAHLPDCPGSQLSRLLEQPMVRLIVSVTDCLLKCHGSVNSVSILIMKHRHGLVTDCHWMPIVPMVPIVPQSAPIVSAADVLVKL